MQLGVDPFPGEMHQAVDSRRRAYRLWATISGCISTIKLTINTIATTRCCGDASIRHLGRSPNHERQKNQPTNRHSTRQRPRTNVASGNENDGEREAMAKRSRARGK
jgi:hypothetical protein